MHIPKFFLDATLSDYIMKFTYANSKKQDIIIITKNTVTLRFSKCDNPFDRPFDKLRVTTTKVDRNNRFSKINLPQ